jgi:2'-5' RNA ligase
MPRLFVALDLPRAAALELAAIQPSPAAGVRLPQSEQMHLTLHYLGEFEVEPVASALQGVRVPPFALEVAGVGRFVSADGAVTLWASVRLTGPLRSLHEAVAGTLKGTGFQPEARPYTPHITLARCEPLAAGVGDELLSRQVDFALPGVPVTEFGLYSSSWVDGVPVYRRERAFALQELAN